MHHLSLLSKQSQDLLSCRVEAVLEDMALTALCDLPEDDPVTVDEFLDLTIKTCNSASEILAKYEYFLCHFVYLHSVNSDILAVI